MIAGGSMATRSPSPAAKSKPAVDLLEIAPQARHIMGEPAGEDALGLPHRAGAGRDALLERAVVLIGEAVIVLDELAPPLANSRARWRA